MSDIPSRERPVSPNPTPSDPKDLSKMSHDELIATIRTRVDDTTKQKQIHQKELNEAIEEYNQTQAFMQQYPLYMTPSGSCLNPNAQPWASTTPIPDASSLVSSMILPHSISPNPSAYTEYNITHQEEDRSRGAIPKKPWKKQKGRSRTPAKRNPPTSKTTPCMFYQDGGFCTKGTLCEHLHDYTQEVSGERLRLMLDGIAASIYSFKTLQSHANKKVEDMHEATKARQIALHEQLTSLAQSMEGLQNDLKIFGITSRNLRRSPSTHRRSRSVENRNLKDSAAKFLFRKGKGI